MSNIWLYVPCISMLLTGFFEEENYRMKLYVPCISMLLTGGTS